MNSDSAITAQIKNQIEEYYLKATKLNPDSLEAGIALSNFLDKFSPTQYLEREKCLNDLLSIANNSNQLNLITELSLKLENLVKEKLKVSDELFKQGEELRNSNPDNMTPGTIKDCYSKSIELNPTSLKANAVLLEHLIKHFSYDQDNITNCKERLKDLYWKEVQLKPNYVGPYIALAKFLINHCPEDQEKINICKANLEIISKSSIRGPAKIAERELKKLVSSTLTEEQKKEMEAKERTATPPTICEVLGFKLIKEQFIEMLAIESFF